MKKIFAISLLIILSAPTYAAKRCYPEAEYQKVWCRAHHGQLEYKLDDSTRIDCLTDTLAVEIDFANKWTECIGQALYYGKKTNKTPACVLIMEKDEKDAKYLSRLRYTVYDKKKIPEFKTFTITPKHICNPDINVNCQHIHP